MPAHFGGWVFDPDAQAIYHDVVSLAYSYSTDGDRLADYIPEGFELTKPELLILYQQCRQIDWMAGSYYNLITVAAPVRFNGQRDQLEGVFAVRQTLHHDYGSFRARSGWADTGESEWL